MKGLRFTLLVIINSWYFSSAQIKKFEIPKSSLFYELNNDSLIIYECRVVDALQTLTTNDGLKINTTNQKFTITTKYFIKNKADSFEIKTYTAAITSFPNRKFSGLKIKEKKYWSFKLDTTFILNEKQLKYFIAAEIKGKEANEFDYAITKYTTYQLIYKHRKKFKQLVYDEKLNLKEFILR